MLVIFVDDRRELINLYKQSSVSQVTVKKKLVLVHGIQVCQVSLT